MTKCSRGCSQRPTIGSMNRLIRVRRKTTSSQLGTTGSASAKTDYKTFLTSWAAVKTTMGVSEYGQVEVGGKRVTHKFIIRYTTVEIDIRDVVEFGDLGQRLAVLGVENLNEQNRYLVINCRNEGRA